MFTTYPPCGDASIFPVRNDEPGGKRPKLDVNRTGAKCLDGAEFHGHGADYHTEIGSIRRKPGRGNPTRSLSCSDKLAKWNLLGIQGAILASIFPGPIRFDSIIVASDLFNREAFSRAVYGRFLGRKLNVDKVSILQSSVDHPLRKRKNEENHHPVSCSIAAFKTASGLFDIEVADEGRKRGLIKKHLGTKKARLKICRKEIAQKFFDTFSINEETKYCDLKVKSVWYNKLKETFLSSVPNFPLRNALEMDSFRISPEAKIFLLKSEETSSKEDKYVIGMKRSGITQDIGIVPTLEFKYCIKDLKVKLKNGNFDGIIFTSKRAVIAFNFAMNSCDIEKDVIKDKLIFTVGKSTQEEVAASLGKDVECLGSESGNATELAKFIVAQTCKPQSLLFPTGSLTDDFLPEELSKAQIKVEKIIAYETRPHSRLTTNTERINSVVGQAILVFFSPSGVNFTKDHLEKASCMTVALGPSTEKALIEAGFKVNEVCLQPNVNEVVKCIKNLIH